MTDTHDNLHGDWDAMHHDQPSMATDATRDTEVQAAWDRSVAAHEALAARPGVTFQADEEIVIVLHPGFDTLDAIGPHYFLSSMLGATIHLATTGEPGAPVVSAGGLPLTPTIALADVADAPTVLLVPGGDTSVLTNDPHAMTDIRRLGYAAQVVASVCTGAIALAAAGLLHGRRATSHWSVRHLLAGYGATPIDERVVVDGNVMTAAGVTAGMDLALRLVGRLRGDEYAQFLELGAEYAPEPPFGTGTPGKAGTELTALAQDFFATVEHGLRAPAT